MGWSSRLFGGEGAELNPQQRTAQEVEESMGPGLTGEYDLELREKAGMHSPPPPPEYMGLEGEYDSQGLVKRVALALDRATDLTDINTLQIDQDQGTVIFTGVVPSQEFLSRIIEVAQRVDGTKAIDTTQVQIPS